MKKYFITQGNKQAGPFSLEELEEMKISRETMVWFSGLDKWMKANHIEELNPIFELIPPPINLPPPIKKPLPPPLMTPPPFIANDDKVEQPVQNKSSKGIYYLLSGILLCAITGGVFYYNSDTKQETPKVEDISGISRMSLKESPKSEISTPEPPKPTYKKINPNELEGNDIFTSTGGKVNVRSSPNEYSEVLYQLELGEQVVYLNDRSSELFTVLVNGIEYTSYWYHIQPMNNADAVGWVHGGFLNIPNDLK